MSKTRRDELAELVAGTEMVIVEDDHSGSISGAELHSFGETDPDRVVHIRSYSKSHGPDLRLAAVSGPAKLLDPVIQRRHLGPSWTSRLLQQVLLELLTDPDEQAQVAAASQTYAQRRQLFVDRLIAQGLPAEALLTLGTGMNVWVPVNHEQRAVTALANEGIGVAPGRPFMVASSDQDFIRITTAPLAAPHDIDRVAKAVADAAQQL